MASSGLGAVDTDLAAHVAGITFYHPHLKREDAVQIVLDTKQPVQNGRRSLAVEVAVQRDGKLAVDSLILSRLQDESGKWRLNLNAEGTLLAQHDTVAGVFTAAAAFFPFPIHRAGHKGSETPTHEPTPAAPAHGTLDMLKTPLRGMGDEDTDDFLNMASAPEGKSVRAQFFDDDTDDVSNFARGAGGGPGTA